MTQALTANQAADEYCQDCGFEPELDRYTRKFDRAVLEHEPGNPNMFEDVEHS